MNKRTLIQRAMIGFKKGWTTPSLPDHINKLHNNVFIRMFRVAGGISVILILTHKLELLGNGILYIITLYGCIFLTFLFSIYSFYISYRYIYIKY